MKSDFINCKNCTDDCHCKGKDITPICLSFKPAKITNADRIRSMTDEELASFAHDHSCIYCPMDDCDGRMNVGRDACYKRWLEWLKQEVKNNE